ELDEGGKRVPPLLVERERLRHVEGAGHRVSAKVRRNLACSQADRGDAPRLARGPRNSRKMRQNTMAEPVLLVDRKGPVATVTLNRPSTKNALNAELVAALSGALPEITRDRTIRVVVLTGAGGAFCSGADLKSGMT